MNSETIDTLVRQLTEEESVPSLFDHATRELSHESLLAYSLDCFKQLLDSGHTIDYAAADFAKALLDKYCFAGLETGTMRKMDFKRQPVLDRNNRADILVKMEDDNGHQHTSIIETKLLAELDANQLLRYGRAFGQGATSNLMSVVFYKSGNQIVVSEDELNRDSVVPVRCVMRSEILQILRSISSTDQNHVFDHYIRWISATEKRWNLMTSPLFAEWYFRDRHLDHSVGPLDTWFNAQDSMTSQEIRQVMYQTLMKNLARSLSFDERTISRYLDYGKNLSGEPYCTYSIAQAADVPQHYLEIMYRVEWQGNRDLLRLCIYTKNGETARPIDTKDFVAFKETFWQHLWQNESVRSFELVNEQRPMFRKERFLTEILNIDLRTISQARLRERLPDLNQVVLQVFESLPTSETKELIRLV